MRTGKLREHRYQGRDIIGTQASLALELANTVRRGPAGTEVDLVATPVALGRWLAEAAEVPGLAADLDLGEADPAEVLLRLSEFRAIRTAIRDLLGAAADGAPGPPEAAEALNRASSTMPSHPVLDLTTGPAVAERTAAGSTTTRLLARVARSAIGLLGDGWERIRRCPAPRCGRFFPAGRAGQVWCSAACGNRARVARHHARRRAGRHP